MILSNFYREQAAQQKTAADSATLDNVRDRAQRAADAWANLAARSERADGARAQIASDRQLLNGLNENPDRGSAAG